ncbi:hypothetical protein [Pseudomonas purpurea]|uniref:hypothetical protein n=1 Tax=Pseudomonas purpurea TaxID=3136737 RepID=UPI003267E11A
MVIVGALLLAVVFFYLLPMVLLIFYGGLISRASSTVRIDFDVAKVSQSFRFPLLIGIVLLLSMSFVHLRFQAFPLFALYLLVQAGLTFGFVLRMCSTSIAAKRADVPVVARLFCAMVLTVLSLISPFVLAIAWGHHYA